MGGFVMGFMEKFFGADMTKTRAEQIYDDAYMLFNSEKLQNECLSRNLKEKVLAGTECDMLPGASGDFGHCAANPIPCNGPMGELTYLSKLRMKTTGAKIFFHKIDHINGTIDKFKIINATGKFIDYLYLDMYHPRKSLLCPAQYMMEGEAVFPRGILTECPDFPKNLYKHIKREAERILKVSVADPEAKAINTARVQAALRELRK